jgi:hypothetical protein
MVLFPRKWITHPDDVREHVRVHQPDQRLFPSGVDPTATGPAGESPADGRRDSRPAPVVIRNGGGPGSPPTA